MPEKEYLQKKIDNLRDKRAQIFNLFFALLSGSVAMGVYVMLGEKPLIGLLITSIGCLGATFLFMIVHRLNQKIDRTLQQLKDSE